MRINAKTAISTSSVLLVPYTKAHVPTYHGWMKDPEIQTLTASEPLSLEEEYDMQRSWRTDADKLTFIICLPVDSFGQEGQQERVCLKAGRHDGEDQMVGDVNLFLSPPDDEQDDGQSSDAKHPPSKGICVGELELMIASPRHRRKGYGGAAILAFTEYIVLHLEQILSEFQGSHGGDEKNLKWDALRLRVKIGGGNAGSIALFEGLGFEKVGEVNYFGEVELRRRDLLMVGENHENVQYVVEGYRELEYHEAE